MKESDKQNVIKQAALDAIGHQEEFPGEKISGDWDSEAFTEMEDGGSDRESAWVVYRDALHAAVAQMIGGATAKPKLELLGADGNAFAILGKAQRVAKQNGLDWDAIQAEAMSGDYDHLLQTMMTHFEVI